MANEENGGNISPDSAKSAPFNNVNGTEALESPPIPEYNKEALADKVICGMVDLLLREHPAPQGYFWQQSRELILSALSVSENAGAIAEIRTTLTKLEDRKQNGN